MMKQFKVRYIPGGMSMYHSAWYVCESTIMSGMMIERPVKFLRRSEYK